MNDLWAEDIVTETVRTPVAILREQASLLGKKTQNVILAEVDSDVSREFKHNFNIKVPALGYYSYTLFTITHSIELYPLKAYLDGEVAKEIGVDATENVFGVSIKDEADLLELLAKILKAERTKQIIRTLLAQSSE